MSLSGGLQLTMASPAGTRLGAYEVTGALGAGGMGEVYGATDTNRRGSPNARLVPAK